MNETTEDSMISGHVGNEGKEGLSGQVSRGEHRIKGVKRLLISDDVLDVLGKYQSSSTPKIDMRYWVEGAISVIASDPKLMEMMASAAKTRLRRALDAGD